MLTLSNCIDTVRDHLDDPDEDRWSEAQIVNSLRAALSHCIEEYVASGGDRLDTVVDFPSASNGVLDLSSQNPLSIKGVSLLIGNRYWPIKSTTFEYRNIAQNFAFPVQVRLIKEYDLPANTAHPLVGEGATAANLPNIFAYWVCVKAAIFCSAKDAEPRNELRYLEQTYTASILAPARIPSSVPFPVEIGFYSDWYQWVWKADERKMILVQR
jgi:hypothetical protein